VPRIRIHENQPIVVVEDQSSARHLWQIRLDEAGLTRAQLFSSAKEFRAAKSQPLSGPVNSKPVYFFDYDLGKGANGLDLLAEIKEDAEKYLVTGHFDDPEIRLRCERDGVFLLPKSLLPEIPIVVV